MFEKWSDTKHAVAGADDQALRLPYGSVCQGCHTSNFDPAKVVPTPTATSCHRRRLVGCGNGIPTEPQTVGSAASSENFVGCSSCHYGTRSAVQPTVRPERHGARAPLGPARQRGDLRSVPFAVLVHHADLRRAARSPRPTPTPITRTRPDHLIQPQMALGGYTMLGSPRAPPAGIPRSAQPPYLNVQSPGLVADSGSCRHLGRSRAGSRPTGRMLRAT